MKFKVGDVVVINSGGPKITVVSVSSSAMVDRVECGWFDEKGVYDTAWLPADAVFLWTEDKPG